MYTKNKEQLNHFKFNQKFPLHSTCSPTTLSYNINRPISPPSRSRVTVVPASYSPEPYFDEEDPYHEPSSWWSWTFGIATFPFFFWGCPFYLITSDPPPKYPDRIRSVRVWLKRIVDCSSSPCSSIVTFILLILTVSQNIYLIFLFSSIFNNLFIRGVYEASMFQDLFDFLRDIPLLIALNYCWLFGYKINSIISTLNQTYRKYEKNVSITSFRVRVVFMLVAIICIHIIKFLSLESHFDFSSEALAVTNKMWEFWTSIFLTLLLPLYCTFCYAVRFELFVIKSIIYELIGNRIMPSTAHLNKFKILYTHAADHIDSINSFFSIYMSVAIGVTIISATADAEKLIEKLGSFVTGSLIQSVFGKSLPEMLNVPPPPPGSIKIEVEGQEITPGAVRQLNGDIVCLVATYGLIYFTVWQAVVTNDTVREIHVWLNDFVAGAGGTDVKDKMRSVGGDIEKNRGEITPPLVWAANKFIGNGENDQFLEKFKMLKSYIHVRMQLEKPALLNIVLVGVFVPSMSGRLRAYNVLF